MGLPFPGNTTAIVYRSGNSPPAAADVDLGRVLMSDNYRRLESGEDMSVNVRYTHIMHFDVQKDVRDGRDEDYTNIGNYDTVYVPNMFGQDFRVVYVQRKGETQEYKIAYLLRGQWSQISSGGTIDPITEVPVFCSSQDISVFLEATLTNAGSLNTTYTLKYWPPPSPLEPDSEQWFFTHLADYPFDVQSEIFHFLRCEETIPDWELNYNPDSTTTTFAQPTSKQSSPWQLQWTLDLSHWDAGASSATLTITEA